MFMLPKANYKFSIISIKIPISVFFPKHRKKNPKIYIKRQKPQQSKQTWQRKAKLEASTFQFQAILKRNRNQKTMEKA